MKLIAMIRFWAIAPLVFWAIAACQSADDQTTFNSASNATADSTNCRTIEHDLGATEVCGQPQRIIALGPYVLEPLLALGIQPIAFADHIAFHQGEYDNPIQQIPYLGDYMTQPAANLGTAFSPSIEVMLKLQPDLILGTSSNNVEQYETFSEIAPTLLFNWDEAQQNLEAIAQVVDRSEQGEDLLKETDQKMASARESFADLVEAHPKLLLLVSSQFSEIYLGSQSGLCSSLTKELGFELVSLPQFESTEPTSPRIPISLEALPQFNEADSIIVLGSNFSELQNFDTQQKFETHQLSNLKQEWEKSAIAQSLNASKAGRVYFVPSYLCLGLPGSIGTELYLEELKEQLLSLDE